MKIKHYELVSNLTTDKLPMRFTFLTHNDIEFTVNDMHYEYELGIILSGSMKRIMDGVSCTYDTGDIWMNNIFEPHSVALCQVPCHIAVFVFRPEFIYNFLSILKYDTSILGIFGLPVQLRPKSIPSKTFRSIVSGLQEAFLASQPINHLWLTGLLLEILSVLNLVKIESLPDINNLHFEDFRSLRPAIDLAMTRKSHIPVMDASKVCNMSRSLFEKKFSQAMKMSYGQFTMRHRIAGAASDLLNIGLTIQDIVEIWGFADASHFNRNFGKYYGISPSNYRKKIVLPD